MRPRRVVIRDINYVGVCGIGDLGNYWASSLANNSIEWQTWFTGYNATGSALSIGPHGEQAALNSTFNNNIRSWEGQCFGSTSETADLSRMDADPPHPVPSHRP